MVGPTVKTTGPEVCVFRVFGEPFLPRKTNSGIAVRSSLPFFEDRGPKAMHARHTLVLHV